MSCHHIILIVVVFGSSQLARADDSSEFTRIYDRLFRQENVTFNFYEVYEQLTQLASLESRDSDLDARIAQLVSAGNFSSNNCTLATFNRTIQLADLSEAHELSIIKPYQEYCIEHQYVSCMDELALELIRVKDFWHPFAQENLDIISQALARENVDSMQPLGLQLDKFSNILEEYKWIRQLGPWAPTDAHGKFRFDLYEIRSGCMKILDPFKRILQIYEIVLQSESAAKHIDEPSLQMVIKLEKISEVLAVIEKILASHFYRS